MAGDSHNDIPAVLAAGDWHNPAVIDRARLPMHAPFHGWTSIADALDEAPSHAQRSLNGDWGFALYDRPELVPDSWRCDDAPDAVAMPVPIERQLLCPVRIVDVRYSTS